MIGSNMGMFFNFKKDKSKPEKPKDEPTSIEKIRCAKIERDEITVNGIEELLEAFNIDYKKSWNKDKKLGVLNARCG